MKKKEAVPLVTGDILNDEAWLSFGELAQRCALDAEYLLEMVDEGVLEPQGASQLTWRFPPTSIHRIHVVLRLRQDLGVNLAGAALVLDLLEEVEYLRDRLHTLGIGL